MPHDRERPPAAPLTVIADDAAAQQHLATSGITGLAAARLLVRTSDSRRDLLTQKAKERTGNALKQRAQFIERLLARRLYAAYLQCAQLVSTNSLAACTDEMASQSESSALDSLNEAANLGSSSNPAPPLESLATKQNLFIAQCLAIMDSCVAETQIQNVWLKDPGRHILTDCPERDEELRLAELDRKLHAVARAFPGRLLAGTSYRAITAEGATLLYGEGYGGRICGPVLQELNEKRVYQLAFPALFAPAPRVTFRASGQEHSLQMMAHLPLELEPYSVDVYKNDLFPIAALAAIADKALAIHVGLEQSSWFDVEGSAEDWSILFDQLLTQVKDSTEDTVTFQRLHSAKSWELMRKHFSHEMQSGAIAHQGMTAEEIDPQRFTQPTDNDRMTARAVRVAELAGRW